jgi:hypothetical protein
MRMREFFMENIGANAKQLPATGVDFGRLKGRQHPGLQQRIDPNRLESGQIARQPPYTPAHPRHLGSRGQLQAFQHRDQFHWRLLRHPVHPHCGTTNNLAIFAAKPLRGNSET